jgi:hypothetical protein
MSASPLSFNDRIHRNNPIMDGNAVSVLIAPGAALTFRPTLTGVAPEDTFKGTWMEIRNSDPAFGPVSVSINSGGAILVQPFQTLSFALDPATTTVDIANGGGLPCSVLFMS